MEKKIKCDDCSVYKKRRYCTIMQKGFTSNSVTVTTQYVICDKCWISFGKWLESKDKSN